MSKFITVPVVGGDDKTLEDLRISVDSILKYRKWLNREQKEQTVLFFKKQTEAKLIIDMPVEELDRVVKNCGCTKTK